MKKILFAAVAALAITGCSQNEEIEKAAKTAEIGFNAIVKNTTRAAVTNMGNLGNFKVHFILPELLLTVLPLNWVLLI